MGARRSTAASRRSARSVPPREKCPNGHDTTQPGQRYKNGECRACTAIRQRRYFNTSKGRAVRLKTVARYATTTKGILARERAYQKFVRGNV